MIIFRLIRWLLNLAVSAIFIFYIALWLPAPLLKHYSDMYSNIYITPYSAANFNEWAVSSEVALKEAQKPNWLMDFLRVVSFPGYHLDFSRLESQFRQEHQTYSALISRLKEVFAANPALQQQWEQRELGRLKGLHGTESKASTNPGGNPMENMVQGALEKMDQLVDTVNPSRDPVMMQLTESRQRANAVGEKLAALGKHWEDEKNEIWADSKQLLAGAWDSIKALMQSATQKATESVQSNSITPADKAGQPTQVYRD